MPTLLYFFLLLPLFLAKIFLSVRTLSANCCLEKFATNGDTTGFPFILCTITFDMICFLDCIRSLKIIWNSRTSSSKNKEDFEYLDVFEGGTTSAELLLCWLRLSSTGFHSLSFLPGSIFERT